MRDTGGADQDPLRRSRCLLTSTDVFLGRNSVDDYAQTTYQLSMQLHQQTAPSRCPTTSTPATTTQPTEMNVHLPNRTHTRSPRGSPPSPTPRHGASMIAIPRPPPRRRGTTAELTVPLRVMPRQLQLQSPAANRAPRWTPAHAPRPRRRRGSSRPRTPQPSKIRHPDTGDCLTKPILAGTEFMCWLGHGSW